MTIRDLLSEAWKTLDAVNQAARERNFGQVAALADMLRTILRQIEYQLAPAIRLGPLQENPPLRDAFDADAAAHVAVITKPK